MKQRCPSFCIPFRCLTLALLLGAPLLEAAAQLNTAKPDEFIKSWLVLKSIPVSSNASQDPSEAAQKKAFAQDWLNEVGGEAKIHPRVGEKQKIGDRQLEWQSINSTSNIIDLQPHPMLNEKLPITNYKFSTLARAPSSRRLVVPVLHPVAPCRSQS